MGVHPDLTARRAVDACGGVFPKAKNDYDTGWQAGHEAALDAAMEAVGPVDEMMADLLEALRDIDACYQHSYGFSDLSVRRRCGQIVRAAIVKVAGE